MTVAYPASPTDLFERERRHLVGLAYRMLGTVADAEDVVQEAWLRWQAVPEGSIDRPAAWLNTVTTRLALDHLRAARRRRESYVGPWLPEPVVTDVGPAETAELAESLRLGFLAVLDELKPVERAVFLLADVFDVPFTEIAATVDKSEAACRQIAHRARGKVTRPHAPRTRGRSARWSTPCSSPSPRVTPIGCSRAWPPTWCASRTAVPIAERRDARSSGATGWHD